MPSGGWKTIVWMVVIAAVVLYLGTAPAARRKILGGSA